MLRERTTQLAFIGALLLWFAYPPLNLFWAAPLGVACWLELVRNECPYRGKEYLRFWLAGVLLWLALLQGVRLAFWALYFGWIALSLYIAVYVPLFILLTRFAIHRWRLPMMLAAPVVWVGLELVRAYFATGFAGNLLGHTLVHQPIAIQFADQLGGYGISAFVVIQACVVHELSKIIRGLHPALRQWSQPGKTSFASIGIGLGICAGILTYGSMRIENPARETAKPLFRAALIQENFPSKFEMDPDRKKAAEAWTAYLEQTRLARQASGELDLVVWPESVFSGGTPHVKLETTSIVPKEWRNDTDFAGMQKRLREFQANNDMKTELVLAAASNQTYQIGVPIEDCKTYLLVGSDYWRITSDQVFSYNTALFINPTGKVQEHYEKQHLVMFGEYIPLGSLVGFPSVQAGEKYQAFKLGDVTLAPSICFESVLPHRVRHQLRLAKGDGASDVVLVNITNDSWFRGSEPLDIHFNCGVFAAVENRSPMIIAGNSGLTAWIDASGRVVKQVERLRAGFVIAEPIADSRKGLWSMIGDLPAIACALACAFFGLGAFYFRKKGSQ